MGITRQAARRRFIHLDSIRNVEDET